MKKRKTIYMSLLSHISNGEVLDGFSPTSDIYLSKNDKKHLKNLIKHLSKCPAEKVLSHFRLFVRLLEYRMDFAINNLLETTPKSSDLHVRSVISARIDNDSDARIIMDVFEWSEERNDPVFITTDIKDIYRNRDDIIRLLREYKFLEADPFSILHIRELVA
ncbi:hypothetical protein CW696_03800 [ANME-2 cluster archaeon]|nr:MAG: hypothetical protein CW696_03800 [ANME-2 cluster archaeon]